MPSIDQANTISSTSSVRKRLTRDITLLVLLLISFFIALSYFYSKQVQENITQAIMTSAKKLVVDKSHQLFLPINNNLVLSRKWAEFETLTPEMHEVFNKRFIPVMETLPQIASVILASSEGDEYYFTRKDDNWLSRHTSPSKYGDDKVLWQLWNSNNKLIKQWHEKSNYKPQQRPWFKLALTTNKKNHIKWTPPYTFYTQETPGVTGVTHWKSETKNGKSIDYILAFDVTFADIAQAISSVHVDDNDISYLISPKGEVILPPGNHLNIKGTPSKGSMYIPGSESNYVIFDSVNNWLKQQRKLDKSHSFSRNGKRWWYKIFVLDIYSNAIYAGVIVPEKDLVAVLNDNLRFIITGILFLLIIAVIMANILVKKYAHQLKDVPKTRISTQDFTNEIYHLLRLGESETLEFKSTMRRNLKTNKNGKEIEIAWLKGIVGFMNTHGGILLIGVDDDSNILGIEVDNFDNEDKILLHFKNLLSQHIGLEFSNFINLIINQIEGKTILVIECERADRPAFLYNKNSEDFYIRSGPASVQLSVSKVLKYVRNRY
ncbi:RNA-binding domain-containing protein [sulfur-oxidizing endosymbiont of Gigantopelta aegis]|uniref:RNA-binding domain-containing protein n=1 Tax=sulfur-oxidizing endosymbiont of Gigantopelta aegis TaxID=2794934 RepID=UPI0018DB3851|nr:RNA-binding domain-containing protein [sulfur-oxidizing endosymbiont of Gigantopelta aegis]